MPKSVKSLNVKMIGAKLRELRENNGLLLRQVAAILEIDTATLSKMEREVKKIRKEHLQKLAQLYHVDINELTAVWLADKLLKELKTEVSSVSKEALQITNEQITT